jgi:hypothetical protein
MLIKQEISLEPYIVTEDDEVGATETSLIVKITQGPLKNLKSIIQREEFCLTTN